MNKKAEKILNTAIRLFIRGGIKKVTMDDIAENSSVSKVTIYKYFVDKDTLFLEVSKHLHSHHVARLEEIVASGESLTEKLHDYLGAISEFTNSGGFDLCSELARYDIDIEAEHENFLQRYRRSMMALIDEGIGKGLLRNDLDRDMIYHYIDMGVVYYQQQSEYRAKMLNDGEFQERYMLFYISNIFADRTTILSTR